MTPGEKLREQIEAALPDGKNLFALSVRQPWAHRIVHEGKDIENRPWPTRYRGRLLLHAAKGVDSADHVSADMPRGGIVGVMTIADCVTASESKWFEGPYGFVLTDVKPLPFIPCLGTLSLFDPCKVADQKRKPW